MERSVNHLSLLCLLLPAFLKSNGSSLSVLSPRRVKREMKKRLIVFCACQLKRIFYFFGLRGKKKEFQRKSIFCLSPQKTKQRRPEVVLNQNRTVRSRQMYLVWANWWSPFLINNWEGDKQHTNVNRWVNVDSQEQGGNSTRSFFLFFSSSSRHNMILISITRTREKWQT